MMFFPVVNKSNVPLGKADLGYYIGYAICCDYYNRSADKAKAVADIIELDYTDKAKVRDFYSRTVYAPK